MPISPRFQVRDTVEELRLLDKAIKRLGYKDRADWYRDMKRKTIAQADMMTEYARIQAGDNDKTDHCQEG